MPTPFRVQVIVAVVGAVGVIGSAIISGVVTYLISERKLELEKEMSRVKIERVQWQLDAEKMRIKGATTNYIDLINKALGEVEDELKRTEGKSQLAKKAGRLTKTRDEFREALREIDPYLDGKFDVLASALVSGEPDERQLRQAVDEFRNAWPAKREGLRNALTKFLGVLGLSA